MRADGDNIMEVDSYILNPARRTHMSTVNMTPLGKPVDRVCDSLAYRYRLCARVEYPLRWTDEQQ